MPKKNDTTNYTPDMQNNGNDSNVWQEIKKTLIASSVTASITLIGFAIITYFTVASNSLRIQALEDDTVRKDVLAEILEPMKDSTVRIENKIDTLVNGFVSIGVSSKIE